MIIWPEKTSQQDNENRHSVGIQQKGKAALHDISLEK